MIFRVDQALLRSAQTVELLAMVRNAAIRSHTLWFVEAAHGDGGDVPAAWTELAGRVAGIAGEVWTLRDCVVRIRSQAATLGTVTVGVEAVPLLEQGTSCDFVVSVQDAVRLCSAPLAVLVEDVIGDAAFLERVIPAFWANWLRIQVRAGRLTYEHGGGAGQIAKFFKQYGNGVRLDPAGLGKSAWLATHIALVDRDKPAEPEVGDQQQSLLDAAAELAASSRVKVLWRRSQEHYLPVEVLREAVRPADILAVERAKSDGAEYPLPKRAVRDLKQRFQSAPAASWPRSWFEADGSQQEMILIAEWISAHL